MPNRQKTPCFSETIRTNTLFTPAEAEALATTLIKNFGLISYVFGDEVMRVYGYPISSYDIQIQVKSSLLASIGERLLKKLMESLAKVEGQEYRLNDDEGQIEKKVGSKWIAIMTVYGGGYTDAPIPKFVLGKPLEVKIVVPASDSIPFLSIQTIQQILISELSDISDEGLGAKKGEGAVLAKLLLVSMYADNFDMIMNFFRSCSYQTRTEALDFLEERKILIEGVNYKEERKHIKS